MKSKIYYLGLETAKELINKNCIPQFEVKETWADYGAGIKHTTLVSVPGRDSHQLLTIDSYQLLTIKEAQDAKLGLLRLDTVLEIIDRVNERGW